jgi:hypothetical protein
VLKPESNLRLDGAIAEQERANMKKIRTGYIMEAQQEQMHTNQ